MDSARYQRVRRWLVTFTAGVILWPGAALALTVPGPEPEVAPDPEESAFAIDRVVTPTDIAEPRGLTRSLRNPELLWAFDDADTKPRIYAIAASGEIYSSVYLFTAKRHSWQDLAQLPDGRMLIGDIGDQQRSRRSVRLIVVDPPDSRGGQGAKSLTYRLVFPKRKAQHAETLLVHPRTGRVFVVVNRPTKSVVYRGPSSLLEGRGNKLTKVRSLAPGITGADILPASDDLVANASGKLYLYSGVGPRLSGPAKITTADFDTPIGGDVAADPWGDLLVGPDASRVIRNLDLNLSGLLSPASDAGDEPATPPVVPETIDPPPWDTEPRTLVSAGFSKAPLGPLSADTFSASLGSGSSESDLDDSSIIADGEMGKGYRLTLDKDTFKSSPGNNGIASFIALPKKVERACMTYSLRFDQDFDWSIGGKLPGLGGVRPGIPAYYPTGGRHPGDKGWSGRAMWVTPRLHSWAGPVNQGISYLYIPTMANRYGDEERWNTGFVAGQWHRVSMCYGMNSVLTEPGGSSVVADNGVLKVTIDGAVVVDRHDVRYRSRSDVGINYLYWHVFRGGSTQEWAGDRVGTVDIDSVSITAY